jgi:hypothetical protein
MKYYIPDIDSSRPDALNYEKLGGTPVGLPPEKWTACKCCGKPQGFLTQFAHHAERLSLGREGRWVQIYGGGRMAYLFCKDKGETVPDVQFFGQC